jgi:hypothetical protein
MIRSKKEQSQINSEIDRRLLEMQSPREIVRIIGSATIGHVIGRAKRLGLASHRITKGERDHLLVRRKEVAR